MRSFIILVIVAAAAVGGWYWYKGRQMAPAEAAAPPALPAEAGPGSSAGLGEALPPPVSEPPAAVQAQIAAAEAAWAAAGGDPATSAQGTSLNQRYAEILRALYAVPGSEAYQQQLVDTRLKPLADIAFFSRAAIVDDPVGLFAVHLVAAGESPDQIARRYGMSMDLLNRLRGKARDDSNLKIGERLKVIKVKEGGGFQLDIDKSEYRVDLYCAGLFVRRYLITLGARETPTPVGKTKVVLREWHPQWTHPVSNKVLNYGDPENILGPVWIAFDSELLGKGGIGMHGYTGPDGKMRAMQSNGCIRFENHNAEEVFGTISPPDRAPTVVEIRE